MAPVEPVADGAARMGWVRERTPWLALLAVYLLWGSTYAAIRVAVRVVPPFTMAGLRYTFAGVILYPLVCRRGPSPDLRSWMLAAVIGALLLTGGNGLLSLGERRVPSGIAALLVATVPLWLVMLERLIHGVRIRARALAGLLGGLAGVGLLVAPSAAYALPIGGAITILVASALWACGSLVSRNSRMAIDPLLATAMEMLTGGALLLAVGAASDEWPRLRLSRIGLDAGFAFAWLVVAGSLIALSAYLYALRTLPTATVGTYAYINPLVAVVVGAVLLGEPVHPRTAVAGSVILGAVALTIANPAARHERRGGSRRP